jgi:hydrogenase maturation protease
MTEKKEKVTILGVGNILLRDEGFGVHFIRWFSQRYKPEESVSIIDGGTLGYALIDIICSCENLIVIDVLKAKDIPGSIYRFNTEEMQAHMPPPTTAHEVTFFDVLFKVELMDELPQTLFLCIIPQDFGDMNMEMTPVMREKFPVMEKFLLAELSKLAVTLERIEDA